MGGVVASFVEPQTTEGESHETGIKISKISKAEENLRRQAEQRRIEVQWQKFLRDNPFDAFNPHKRDVFFRKCNEKLARKQKDKGKTYDPTKDTDKDVTPAGMLRDQPPISSRQREREWLQEQTAPRTRADGEQTAPRTRAEEQHTAPRTRAEEQMAPRTRAEESPRHARNSPRTGERPRAVSGRGRQERSRAVLGAVGPSRSSPPTFGVRSSPSICESGGEGDAEDAIVGDRSEDQKAPCGKWVWAHAGSTP